MNKHWKELDYYYYSTKIPRYEHDEIILSSSCIAHVLQLFDRTMEGYLTRQQFADKLVFKIKDRFSEEKKRLMSNGVKNEAVMIEKYTNYISSEFNREDILITTPFLCRPKFDTRLTCKSDGLIYINNKLDGLLEIKTTHTDKRMHKLRDIIDKLNDNEDFMNNYEELDSNNRHKFIESYHYAQVQFALQCYNVNWCDYIISYPAKDEHLLWRIEKNDKYWNEYMYPSIKSFFDFEINNSKRSKQNIENK